MRHLPHLATILRPAPITDTYGDVIDGPLAPLGDPIPAWLQIRSSSEDVRADGQPVTTTPRLYVWPSSGLVEDDVVEVDGLRYRVTGDVYVPVNPGGRARLGFVDLTRVQRGS